MGSCPGCRRAVAVDRCDHCGAVQRVGDYRILEVRVQNQHGRLYLAADAKDRRVALKELCFMQAPSFDALDAFEREARILCALDHPCLPRFIESFQHGEGVSTRLYLAQEFIHGESLEERLAGHYFDEAEIRSIAEQVLHIVVWLQARSPMVIHRDIKPANLIRKPDGTIVLVDFGAARDQGSTAGATQVGTFGFMPIEQLAGIVDNTTDVYALGASLVRLLTRREPWKLLDEPWKHMTASPALRRWLQKATAKRPEDRFASAAAALAALKVPRRSSRRPIAFAALAAGIVAGGGIAYGLYGEATKPVKPELPATDVLHATPGGTWIDHGSSPIREPSPQVAREEGCDEVTCVLNNYEGTCCTKFRRPLFPPRDTGPQGIDRAMIRDGVQAVLPLVRKCGDKSAAKGTVKVSVKVAPAGTITSVVIKQTPEPALGDCVAKAMQRAHFAATEAGGSFGYPFVF